MCCSLIQTKRESCVAETARCLYQWNQVEPAEVLTHNVPVDSTPTLLQLHTGVALIEDDEAADNAHITRHLDALRNIVTQ